MDTKKKLVTVTVAALGLTIGFSFGDADCLSDVGDSTSSSVVPSTAPDTSSGSSTSPDSTTEVESTAGGATETVSSVPDIGL